MKEGVAGTNEWRGSLYYGAGGNFGIVALEEEETEGVLWWVKQNGDWDNLYHAIQGTLASYSL